MAINTITLEFEPCEPAPANGYAIHYRPIGSVGPYRTWPNVTASPAVIVDENDDPPGTDYEGYIQGDCGGDVLGVQVPWATAIDNESDGSSPSISDGGGDDSDFEPFNMFIQNDIADGEISEISPNVAPDIEYPVVPITTQVGHHSGFSGSLTVSIVGTTSAHIKLFKNFVELQCLPVPAPGDYVFAPVTFLPGDLCSIILSSGTVCV